MIRTILAVILTLAMPCMLFVSVWQTSRYIHLEKEVQVLVEAQEDAVAMNKRLISGISVLSSPERIEKVAVQNLGMRKAFSDEIMRISLKKGDLGG